MRFFKKNQKKIKVLSFCFLVSFCILLFTSKCSFFYPFNDWVDANAFFTVGKSMFHGVVPYRDLFEQKGPFLYFIYGIGYLISHKSFLGVFLLEVLFWTVHLYFVYKILLFFIKEKNAYILLPIYTVTLCTREAFVHGGGAEEFCLPFFSMTLYFFLAHFKEKEICYKHLFLSGMCAGIVLMIKYTLLGFWFGFMAMLFFSLLKEKKVKKAFLSCGVFLSGMFIIIGICFFYLGIHHAIGDFFKVYFVINMTAYSEEVSSLFVRLLKVYKGFYSVCKNSGFIERIFIVGMPLFLLKLDMKRFGKLSLFVVYLFSILGVFFGLKFYRYYLFPMFVFILISYIVVASFLEKMGFLKRNFYFIFFSFVFSVGGAYLGANYREMLFTQRKDFFQFQFADIILQRENPTLVNIGYLDCGVYTTTGIIPSTYFFERQNIDYAHFKDNIDSFQKYIEDKETLFIVYFTKLDEKTLREREKMLFLNYDLLMVKKQKFEHQDFIGYLFERKEVE